MNFKLGKLAARHDARTLAFAAYRMPSIVVKVPAKFGYASLISQWDLLGNDQYGDCVWAGAAHETMLWNAENKLDVTFTPGGVLSDYSAVTGFVESDPNSDQGTDVLAAMNYRRKTGVIDAASNRHQIGAYVALEPGDFEQLLEASFIFGVVGIGINFPSSAMDQFNAGKPWSVVSRSQIEGGHYVPVIARERGYVDVVTWGAVQRMTKGFYEKYCDEAYAILSLEAVGDAGKTIDGFDLPTLQAIWPSCEEELPAKKLPVASEAAGFTDHWQLTTGNFFGET